MIIAVNGNLIDTTKIYKISEVEGNRIWNTGKTEEEAFKIRELSSSGYSFFIYFLNEKEHEIYLPGNRLFGCSWWNNYDKDYQEYIDRCNAIKNMLDSIRNTIVAYWNESKLEIPQINF